MLEAVSPTLLERRVSLGQTTPTKELLEALTVRPHALQASTTTEPHATI